MEKVDFEGGNAGKKKERRMRRMRTSEKRVRTRMILRNEDKKKKYIIGKGKKIRKMCEEEVGNGKGESVGNRGKKAK